MITVSDAAAAIIESGSYVSYIAVESWLGDTLLAESVPVSGAAEETDFGLRVPERVTFTVPRIGLDGKNWDPTGDDAHPLAANGQRLVVKLGIGLGPNGVEWFQRGEFPIFESEPQGNTVSVTAVGILYPIFEARFVAPFQPSGTLGSTLRSLVEPSLTLMIDEGLTDRSIASNVSWFRTEEGKDNDDRLRAFFEVVDNWPARYRTHEDGYGVVEQIEQSTTPVRTLVEGEGGTVVLNSVVGRSTREGAANTFVVESANADGAIIRGVAYDPKGPKAVNGPFNAFPVPFTLYTPIANTQAAVNAAAITLRNRKKLENARQLEVQIPPDPRIQIGDLVSLTTLRFTEMLCSVWSLNLPYVPGDGQAMNLRLREIA